MKKDYTKIENEIGNRYKNLLSNVSSPDALLRSETVKKRRKENKNDQSRSFGPAAYWLAAALTLVLTVGVTLFGIKMLNTLGNSTGTDTSTAAETTGAEDTVRRMIIKAKTYVFGEEMNNIDLNGSEREFDLVVSFENVSDLKSASLKISWEKPGLTLKNAEYMVNGLTSTPDKPWSEVKNSYVFNWLAIDAKDVIKSRTKFVKLTFRGSDDIYPGTVRIKIKPDQSNIFDSDSNDVPYTLESETVYFDFLHYTLSDTADHSTKEPDPDPETYYPEYLIVSDDNEEIQVKAYEESADGATDVSVLQYDGSKIKPEFSGITVIEGVTVEKIGIKADGVPGDYYENYINDYLETKNTGVYRFVVSYEITNNGVSERWEYPFDVEVWIKSDTTDPDPETTAPETTAPETTAPETTAEETTEPVEDDISKYLHYSIIDPSEDESGLLDYQFGSEKFAVLNSIDKCSFTTVTLPDTYEGYQVKAIMDQSGSHVFSKIKGLKYLELPDTIVSMSIGQFIGCTDIVEVKLPKYMTEIPQSTFWCCHTLKSVVMPDSLTYIGSKAFYECKALRFEGFPSSLKRISSSAFAYCESLTKLNFNDGLEFIGGSAFAGCINVKEITIPKSVKSYGSECFYNTSIKKITVPAYTDYDEKIGATSAGDRMFLYCVMLEDVTLEEGTTVIGAEMFKHCTRLKKLTLPQSTEKIGAYAFSESAIGSVYVGKNVKIIDERAFDGFDGEVTIDPENKYYIYKNGELIQIRDRYDVISATEESTLTAEMNRFVEYLNESVKSGNVYKFLSEMSDSYISTLSLPDNCTEYPIQELYPYITWLRPAVDAGFDLTGIHFNQMKAKLGENRTGEVTVHVMAGAESYTAVLNLKKNDDIWQIESVGEIEFK